MISNQTSHVVNPSKDYLEALMPNFFYKPCNPERIGEKYDLSTSFRRVK